LGRLKAGLQPFIDACRATREASTVARHSIPLDPGTLHGYFSRELSPVVTIDSGDTVCCQTLDAGWGALDQADPFAPPAPFTPRDQARHFGHALTGPIAVRGARPGMTLEVRFRRIRMGTWGWSAGPGLPSQIDARLGLPSGAGGPLAVITVPIK
jgi:hypothetical protein